MEIADSCQHCQSRDGDYFCSFSSPALRAFEKLSFTSTFPKGAVIFVEEQAARGIFVLCRGRVKLSVNSSDGKTLIVRIAEPGEVLGLSSTVLHKPYQVTAETLEPCQLKFVKAEDFLQFLQKDADVCFRVAQQLSEEYNQACREIGSLGLSHSAAERLASLLLDWGASNGGVKQPVRLTLTHEEMAQMIGTSRETVTRLLGKFKQRQLIQLRGSSLLIRNAQELQALAVDARGLGVET
jgi:CRP/FNR family transcriptional regulator